MKNAHLKKCLSLVLILGTLTSCGDKKITQIIQGKNEKTSKSPTTLQGDRTGSGGDALVCLDEKTGEIQSVELWDYVEGKVLDNLNVDLGSPKLSALEKFDLYLKRLEQYDNGLASNFKALRNYAENITKGESSPDGLISFIVADGSGSDYRLKDIKDANLVVELYGKNNCEIWQIARQEKVYGPGTSMIKFDPRLTKKMSADHLAGLIIHEFMIALFYDKEINAFENTDAIRKLNVVLASNALETRSIPTSMIPKDSVAARILWKKYSYATLYTNTGAGRLFSDSMINPLVTNSEKSDSIYENEVMTYKEHKNYESCPYKASIKNTDSENSTSLYEYKNIEIKSTNLPFNQSYYLAVEYDEKEILSSKLIGKIQINSGESSLQYVLEGKNNKILKIHGISPSSIEIDNQNITVTRIMNFLDNNVFLSESGSNQSYQLEEKSFPIVEETDIAFKLNRELQTFNMLEVNLQTRISDLPKSAFAECAEIHHQECQGSMHAEVDLTFNSEGKILTAYETCAL